MLDTDNFHGGCKLLIDALVKEGFLLDDSPAHCVMEFEQHVENNAGYRRTHILIEPIE